MKKAQLSLIQTAALLFLGDLLKLAPPVWTMKKARISLIQTVALLFLGDLLKLA